MLRRIGGVDLGVVLASLINYGYKQGCVSQSDTKYHKVIHFSHFRAEAANVLAEAWSVAAIATVPPQRTGAAVVRRSAREDKGKRRTSHPTVVI